MAGAKVGFVVWLVGVCMELFHRLRTKRKTQAASRVDGVAGGNRWRKGAAGFRRGMADKGDE